MDTEQPHKTQTVHKKRDRPAYHLQNKNNMAQLKSVVNSSQCDELVADIGERETKMKKRGRGTNNCVTHLTSRDSRYLQGAGALADQEVQSTMPGVYTGVNSEIDSIYQETNPMQTNPNNMVGPSQIQQPHQHPILQPSNTKTSDLLQQPNPNPNQSKTNEEVPSMKDQANGPVSPTEFSELTQKLAYDNLQQLSMSLVEFPQNSNVPKAPSQIQVQHTQGVNKELQQQTNHLNFEQNLQMFQPKLNKDTKLNQKLMWKQLPAQIKKQPDYASKESFFDGSLQGSSKVQFAFGNHQKTKSSKKMSGETINKKQFYVPNLQLIQAQNKYHNSASSYLQSQNVNNGNQFFLNQFQQGFEQQQVFQQLPQQITNDISLHQIGKEQEEKIRGHHQISNLNNYGGSVGFREGENKRGRKMEDLDGVYENYASSLINSYQSMNKMWLNNNQHGQTISMEKELLAGGIAGGATNQSIISQLEGQRVSNFCPVCCSGSLQKPNQGQGQAGKESKKTGENTHMIQTQAQAQAQQLNAYSNANPHPHDVHQQENQSMGLGNESRSSELLVCRCRVTAPELTKAFLAAQSHPSELSMSAINAVTLNNYLHTNNHSTRSKQSREYEQEQEQGKPVDTQQLEIETSKVQSALQLSSLTPVKVVEVQFNKPLNQEDIASPSHHPEHRPSNQTCINKTTQPVNQTNMVHQQELILLTKHKQGGGEHQFKSSRKSFLPSKERDGRNKKRITTKQLASQKLKSPTATKKSPLNTTTTLKHMDKSKIQIRVNQNSRKNCHIDKNYGQKNNIYQQRQTLREGEKIEISKTGFISQLSQTFKKVLGTKQNDEMLHMSAKRLKPFGNQKTPDLSKGPTPFNNSVQSQDDAENFKIQGIYDQFEIQNNKVTNIGPKKQIQKKQDQSRNFEGASSSLKRKSQSKDSLKMSVLNQGSNKSNSLDVTAQNLNSQNDKGKKSDIDQQQHPQILQNQSQILFKTEQVTPQKQLSNQIDSNVPFLQKQRERVLLIAKPAQVHSKESLRIYNDEDITFQKERHLKNKVNINRQHQKPIMILDKSSESSHENVQFAGQNQQSSDEKPLNTMESSQFAACGAETSPQQTKNHFFFVNRLENSSNLNLENNSQGNFQQLDDRTQQNQNEEQKNDFAMVNNFPWKIVQNSQQRPPFVGSETLIRDPTEKKPKVILKKNYEWEQRQRQRTAEARSRTNTGLNRFENFGKNVTTNPMNFTQQRFRIPMNQTSGFHLYSNVMGSGKGWQESTKQRSDLQFESMTHLIEELKAASNHADDLQLVAADDVVDRSTSASCQVLANTQSSNTMVRHAQMMVPPANHHQYAKLFPHAQIAAQSASSNFNRTVSQGFPANFQQPHLPNSNSALHYTTTTTTEIPTHKQEIQTISGSTFNSRLKRQNNQKQVGDKNVRLMTSKSGQLGRKVVHGPLKYLLDGSPPKRLYTSSNLGRFAQDRQQRSNGSQFIQAGKPSKTQQVLLHHEQETFTTQAPLAQDHLIEPRPQIQIVRQNQRNSNLSIIKHKQRLQKNKSALQNILPQRIIQNDGRSPQNKAVIQQSAQNLNAYQQQRSLTQISQKKESLFRNKVDPFMNHIQNNYSSVDNNQNQTCLQSREELQQDQLRDKQDNVTSLIGPFESDKVKKYRSHKPSIIGGGSNPCEMTYFSNQVNQSQHASNSNTSIQEQSNYSHYKHSNIENKSLLWRASQCPPGVDEAIHNLTKKNQIKSESHPKQQKLISESQSHAIKHKNALTQAQKRVFKRSSTKALSILEQTSQIDSNLNQIRNYHD